MWSILYERDVSQEVSIGEEVSPNTSLQSVYKWVFHITIKLATWPAHLRARLWYIFVPYLIIIWIYVVPSLGKHGKVHKIFSSKRNVDTICIFLPSVICNHKTCIFIWLSLQYQSEIQKMNINNIFILKKYYFAFQNTYILSL
jgi:hypothetical protein